MESKEKIKRSLRQSARELIITTVVAIIVIVSVWFTSNHFVLIAGLITIFVLHYREQGRKELRAYMYGLIDGQHDGKK